MVRDWSLGLSFPRKPLVACLVVISLAALLPTAVALANSAMTAPATARLHARITASATGLKPGTYRLVLDKNTTKPGAGAPEGCAAAFGPAVKAQGGRVTITGAIPGRLACNSAAGPVEGYMTTSSGSYRLEIGGYQSPIFSLSQSFVARTIRLTR
jgi:hypothetical protein